MRIIPICEAKRLRGICGQALTCGQVLCPDIAIAEGVLEPVVNFRSSGIGK